ncbi:hypothetical protein [Novosphingobium soli]|uniref:DUF4148 domain-containing protein n=1 Tax=Novosphingobium soli TaxID=574956 RepID=A0ABV6CQQ3_9SPHN
MKQTKIIRAAALALAAIPTVAVAVPMLYEEQVARQEENLILRQPIAGIENSHWFDYRGNVNETQKELASDLRHATDTEDRRDAWDEYAVELRQERQSYVKAMAKKGYRAPRVYIED